MIGRSLVRRVTTGAALVTGAACREPTVVGPAELHAAFDLVLFAGSPLPCLALATPRDSVLLTAGAVTFARTGRVTTERVTRRVLVAERRDSVVHTRWVQHFSVDGAGAIQIFTPCPRGAVCAPEVPRIARLRGDTLEITEGILSPNHRPTVERYLRRSGLTGARSATR